MVRKGFTTKMINDRVLTAQSGDFVSSTVFFETVFSILIWKLADSLVTSVFCLGMVTMKVSWSVWNICCKQDTSVS